MAAGVVPVMLALSASLASPASFGATPPAGSLSQLAAPFNCVGEQGFDEEIIGCETLLPAGAIDGSYQAVVSPDGRNVYSVAIDGALVEYSRDLASGALTPIGCVTGTTEPCAPENVTTDALAMAGPAAIALSPNGQNAYVVAQSTNNALVSFTRDPVTGLLTEQGCISEEVAVASECATAKGKGLTNPYGVAVSADGRNVYVSSHDDEAVAEFSRDTSSGQVAQLEAPNECISSIAHSGCATDTATGLEKAIGVAVSPDGSNVYVAAGATEGEGALVAFKRDAEGGALTQLPGKEGCISTSNTGCEAGIAIDGPEDLLISPDGRNVYANSSQSNAVLEFRREPSGALAQLASPNACVMKEPAKAGCTPAKGLEDALGVAIGPTGEDVYASSPEEDDEAAFTRNAETGALTQFPAPYECIAKSSERSACETTGIRGLAGARRVTVSPDGMNLYVAGQNDHSVVELHRAVVPSISAVQPAGGPAAGGTEVTIQGSGFVEGASVMLGSNAASSVRVSSAESITAVAPAGQGTVGVTVTTFAGSASLGSAYTYSSSGAGVTGSPTPSLVASIAGAVPPPRLALSGNVAPVSGRVLVQLPGSSTFVPLTALRQIPFGTVVNATNGKVTVTTITPNGKLQAMTFYQGEFKLTQTRTGQVVAALVGGNFSVCPTARERSHIAIAAGKHASGKHVVRKLWAEGHGSYSTKGNYAAGAVLGTRWLTEDLCEGTLIHVMTDKVAVTNLVNHRHVTVKAGHSYLAKAP